METTEKMMMARRMKPFVGLIASHDSDQNQVLVGKGFCIIALGIDHTPYYALFIENFFKKEISYFLSIIGCIFQGKFYFLVFY